MEIAVLAQHDRTRAVVIDTLRQVGALAPARNQESLRWEESVRINYKKEETDLKSNVERKILDSLKFSTMTDRIDEIPEAHIRTCH
jgi:hypothetical protein